MSLNHQSNKAKKFSNLKVVVVVVLELVLVVVELLLGRILLLFFFIVLLFGDIVNLFIVFLLLTPILHSAEFISQVWFIWICSGMNQDQISINQT